MWSDADQQGTTNSWCYSVGVRNLHARQNLRIDWPQAFTEVDYLRPGGEARADIENYPSPRLIDAAAYYGWGNSIVPMKVYKPQTAGAGSPRVASTVVTKIHQELWDPRSREPYDLDLRFETTVRPLGNGVLAYSYVVSTEGNRIVRVEWKDLEHLGADRSATIKLPVGPDTRSRETGLQVKGSSRLVQGQVRIFAKNGRAFERVSTVSVAAYIPY